MRHVPIAEFKDKVSEVVAAVEAGEDITITRHGREVVRLVGIERDRMERQRAAVDELFAIGRDVRDKAGPTSSAEVEQWIAEGRR